VSNATRRRFPSRLYAILDADVAARAGWLVPDLADAYLRAGVRFLQLRAKTSSSRDVLAWTDAIASRAPADAWLIVNDRVDLALAAGTRHVHLGQDDLPPVEARRLLGDAAVIGLSTHTPAQIAAACAMPIDYLAVGPVFGTRTKDTGYAAVGLDLVREARAQAAAAAREDRNRLPIVAIGGITRTNAADVIAAGADAVAVITDLLRGGDPVLAVQTYLAALGEG
jgi:thiamine-phosphate pyrophosphorylase